MRSVHPARFAFAAVLATTLTTTTTGCGRVVTAPMESGEPRRSVSTPSASLRPSFPAGVVATRLAFGRDSLEVMVGETTRISVQITGSDGKVYTDPRLVSWSLSDAAAATIDETGTIVPLSQRATMVRGRVGDQSAEFTLIVKPAQFTWQQVQSPTVADLYTARLVSPQDGWAAGAGGAMVRYFNGTWQAMNYPIPATTTWRGLDFASPGSGWLVGTQSEGQAALAMVWRQGTWYPTPVNQSGRLHAVAAVNETLAWAGGQDAQGKVLLTRWNGQGWVRDLSYQGKGVLNAIQMFGNDGWAVGSDGSDALILHHDASGWKRVSLPPLFGTLSSSRLEGLCFLNAQQGYAVGSKTNLAGVEKGLILRYEGRSNDLVNLSSWKDLDAASGATRYLDQVPLHGMALLEGTNGWLIGSVVKPNRMADPSTWAGGTVQDVYGNLLRFNGVSYDIDPGTQAYNLARDFTAIHVLPDGNGVIAGRRGYLMLRAFDWRNIRTGAPVQNGGSTLAGGNGSGPL